MKLEIQKMHEIWNDVSYGKSQQPTPFPKIRLDEIMGSLFTSGPFTYFIIDFYNMQISHVSSSFEEMFGIASASLTLDDILRLIHPDDMDFVSKAEEMAIQVLYNKIGKDKVTHYKTNYCFRSKMADGGYQLFLHQAIILTTDENGRFGKSLNIHTNIQHLTTQNNYKLSLVGLFGEPSFLNIDVITQVPPASFGSPFSKRETGLIALIAEGYTNKEIAAKLFISIETVKIIARILFVRLV